MKNLYTKNEFLKINENTETVNEGFFQFLGKMYNKAKAYFNNIKGGKEILKIYTDYKGIIENEFKNKADIDLQLTAEEQVEKSNKLENDKNPKNDQRDKVTVITRDQSKGQENDIQDAEIISDSAKYSKIDEDIEEKDETAVNVKMDVKKLKQKEMVLQQILDKYKNIALKKMDQILSKYGGSEKNPKLARMISLQKDQFDLDFLNAKIKYLEQGGDKVTANKLASKRNLLAKELSAKWNLDTVEQVEIEAGGRKFKLGSLYRYKTPDGIKIIKITGKSDDPNDIEAAYISKDMSSKGIITPQDFKIMNIEKDTEFKPKSGEKYKYYNAKDKKTYEVDVVSVDGKGLVSVKVGDNGFKVPKNALMNINN